VHTNKESTRELAAEAASWTQTLVKTLTAAPPALLPILQGQVEEMIKCVLLLLVSTLDLTDGQSAGRNCPVKQATGGAEYAQRSAQ
jgi:hypothetical protein